MVANTKSVMTNTRATQKYIEGWVAGYDLQGVKGDPTCYVEENVSRYTSIRGRKVWRNESKIRLFKTADEARLRAEEGQTESNIRNPVAPAKWFWRLMIYETNNPAHAKGMEPFDPSTHTKTFQWVVPPPPPGQRYVDVTPDPYLLALALGRVR